MDTNQLSAFITVAETGSFSVAAEKLHITQPAISKRIAVLEQQLSASLFDRIGKRVKLTEAGKVLLPRAKKMIWDLDDTRASIRNLANEVSGRFSLASSHHIGLHRLPPVLRDYSRQFPAVKIDISFLDSEQAYRQVFQGEIELAVVTLALTEFDRIYSKTLWKDELRIMTSYDHPLTKYKNLRLKDLLDYPAILPGENTFTRQLIEQLFRKRQLELKVEMSTNYLETISMIVSIGMAWSVLPEIMQDNNLKILPIKNVRLSRDLGYIYHREHTLSNACSAFIKTLENHGL